MSTQETAPLGAELVLACIRRYREHQKSPILQRKERDQGRSIFADLDFTPEGLVNDMFDDPARTILRGRVRELALSAYAEHGMRGLTRLFDAVEEADPSAASLLDKWFNGIGGWAA